MNLAQRILDVGWEGMRSVQEHVGYAGVENGVGHGSVLCKRFGGRRSKRGA
jgi:hypothetical protein